MSIGDDVLEAIIEVGITFEIKDVDGNTTSENHLLFSDEPPPTYNPLIRKCDVPYNSIVRAGDLIYIPSDVDYYIVLSIISDSVSNEVYIKTIEVCKCNALITVERLIKGTGFDPITFHKIETETIVENRYCSLLESSFSFESNEFTRSVIQSGYRLVFPGIYSIKENDTIQFSSMKLQLISVEKRLNTKAIFCNANKIL